MLCLGERHKSHKEAQGYSGGGWVVGGSRVDWMPAEAGLPVLSLRVQSLNDGLPTSSVAHNTHTCGNTTIATTNIDKPTNKPPTLATQLLPPLGNQLLQHLNIN